MPSMCSEAIKPSPKRTSPGQTSFVRVPRNKDEASSAAAQVSLTLPPTYPGGEIGRRAVFRRLCLRACWFESSSGYFKSLGARVGVFLCLKPAVLWREARRPCRRPVILFHGAWKPICPLLGRQPNWTRKTSRGGGWPVQRRIQRAGAPHGPILGRGRTSSVLSRWTVEAAHQAQLFRRTG